MAVSDASIESLVSAVEDLTSQIAKGRSNIDNDPNKPRPKADDPGLGGFAKGLVDGTASVRGLASVTTDVAKIIPFFGDSIKAAAMNVTDYTLNTYAEFTKLSKVGASLSGDLGLLRQSAGEARMSLPEFSKMVRNNAGSLAQFGGGMQNAIKNFGRLSKAMFDGPDSAGDTFMRLGYSIEETNEFMLDNVKIMRRSAAFARRDEKEQVAAAANLAKQFDIVAKLTGKQAKEIQKEMEATMSRGDLTATLMLAERNGAEGAMQATQNMLAGLKSVSEAGKSTLVDILNLGNPLDETNAMFAAMNPVQQGIMREMKSTMEDTGLSAAERDAKMSELGRKLDEAALQEMTSTQNLQVARTAKINEAGRVASASVEQLTPIIAAINGHAAEMEKQLGRTVTNTEAFNNLMSSIVSEQNAQIAASGQGQAAMKIVTETTQGIATAQGRIQEALGVQLSSNDVFTEGISKLGDALNEANLSEKFTNLSEALMLIGNMSDPSIVDRQGGGDGDAEKPSWWQGFKRMLGFRATGGSVNASGSYMINEGVGRMNGEILKGQAGTMLSAEQSNNLITQAVSQSSQDFGKLNETMQAVSGKLDMLVAINTAQNRNQKQTVDAIRGSRNLQRGV